MKITGKKISIITVRPRLLREMQAKSAKIPLKPENNPRPPRIGLWFISGLSVIAASLIWLSGWWLISGVVLGVNVMAPALTWAFLGGNKK